MSGTLNGAGSSAQEAAQGAWTAGFQTGQPRRHRQLRPESAPAAAASSSWPAPSNFAGSDAYLDDDASSPTPRSAARARTAIEVPELRQPDRVVFNVDGVDKLQLSPDTAAKIFAGKITKWDDAAIKADNPDAELPAQTITPVHRSDDSGTTENFTDYLHQTARRAPGPPSAARPGRSRAARARTAPPA